MFKVKWGLGCLLKLKSSQVFAAWSVVCYYWSTWHTTLFDLTLSQHGSGQGHNLKKYFL